MDLSYSAAHRQFQAEVDAFLADDWDAGKARDKEFVAAFRQRATRAGYLYRSIPKAYGGAGQTPDVLKGHIVREAFGKARAPREVSGNGVMMLVPTLLEHGTDAQKATFIPKTLTGDFRWAQGYSEPNAGSDLASLQTRTVLDGDSWRITGQKIWTTDADRATHMFALVRSEPEAPTKHAGISYLLLAMDQPGVTVRPLRPIYGGHAFCEVFLDDAMAPADWLVGKRGDGWTVSKSTLKHERNAVGAGTASKDLFDKLVRLARDVTINSAPAIHDPLIANALGKLEGHVLAHYHSGYYQMTKAAADEDPGPIALMNKLNSVLIGESAAALAQDILQDAALEDPVYGPGVRPGPERWVNQILGALAAAIGGGTSNIQRNIIAERALGLPRED